MLILLSPPGELICADSMGLRREELDARFPRLLDRVLRVAEDAA